MGPDLMDVLRDRIVPVEFDFPETLKENFIFMITGENDPMTLNTLATSDTMLLLVTVVSDKDSATVTRNSSVDIFHSTQVCQLTLQVQGRFWIICTCETIIDIETFLYVCS